MREKRASFFSVSIIIGITPACAGKTDVMRSTLNTIRDHPRVCGKNLLSVSVRSTILGSPPRVREKHIVNQVCHFRTRITPACAGKTTFSAFAFMIPRDHPRVCGKNSANLSGQLANLGSPPRVREKLFVTFVLCLKLRITPACAGKTLKDPNEIKTFLSF
mgnify:CR=1 FL=1